jgi:hypothetical protein
MPGSSGANLGGPPLAGVPGASGAPSGGFGAASGGAGLRRGFGRGPGGFGGNSATLTAAVGYAAAHGGGTVGVSSQSSAAAAILSSNANVAGLGGFSGRESSVSVTWLAAQVRAGNLRWVLVDSSGMGVPGDTRTGSSAAMSIVAKTCPVVTLTANGTKVTMYDCAGKASAILKATNGRTA